MKSYLLVEDLQAERDRLVAEVGLGKAEAEVPRQVADVGLYRQRLAETEEVVGLVVQADEGSRKAADTAVQADRVLALLLELQQQVDGVVVGVLTALGVLLGLERLEVVQLVQAQDRQLPELAVVDLAFFQQKLAADDLVARDGVARELDARYVEGLAFVDVDVEDRSASSPRRSRGTGVRHEVDVAALTVGLAQLLQPLAEHGGVEVFAVLLGELRTQRLHVRVGLVAREGDATELVACSLLQPASGCRCACRSTDAG